jgi:hypothetical protein
MKMLYLLGDDAERDGWEARLVWDIVQDALGNYRADSHGVLYNTRTKTYLDFTRYGTETQERWLIPDVINTRKLKVADMANKNLSDEERIRHIESKEMVRMDYYWDADRARSEADQDVLQTVSDLTHSAWTIATLSDEVEAEKFRAVIRKNSKNPTTVMAYEDSMIVRLLRNIQNDLSINFPQIYRCGDGKTAFIHRKSETPETLMAKVALCESVGFKFLDYNFQHLLVLPGLERLEDGNYKFARFTVNKEEGLFNSVINYITNVAEEMD